MSLIPATHNFTIYQGATFYQRIFYEIEEALVDLDEHEVTLWIKDQPGGKTLLKLNSFAQSEQIKLGGSAGTIDITITDGETATLEWTQGSYELFVINNGLSPERTDVILRGGFKVVPF